MSNNDALLVGRVARAHGNRGQVIVNLETDFPQERFRVGQVLLVGRGGEPRAITEVRFHQGRPVIALEGIGSMDDADALSGADLMVPASAVEPLPGGMFYRHDLVGCVVRDGLGTLVGEVTAVEGDLERSRLVVSSERGEVLIPLVDSICIRVDPAARLIVVEPPEGLLELNVTKTSQRVERLRPERGA
ncbi:MAG TPA: ribosome maturation factor RimM [Vicinamibacterales bacterium]|nr:ribosome maturation factor RimM [Vicinamibacterales bacterium]